MVVHGQDLHLACPVPGTPIHVQIRQMHSRAEVFDRKSELTFKYLQVDGRRLAGGGR